jgi:hypothetical protein
LAAQQTAAGAGPRVPASVPACGQDARAPRDRYRSLGGLQRIRQERCALISSLTMLLGTNPLLSTLDPTVRWIVVAADDPQRRLAGVLPPELDFRPWAALLHSLQSSALPETQLGASLLLGPEGLEVAEEMAWRSRYPAFVDGKRFIGTVHVHPKGSAETFDAADLAAFLRSDCPGFLDLLVAPESASAIVRTRRFLYISGDRVDREPLLLQDLHPGFRPPLTPDPAAKQKAAAEADAAVRTVCSLYELALYRGVIGVPLRTEYRPR